MLLILRAVGAGDELMTLTLIAFATPLGLNTIVFPAAYGGETKTGVIAAAHKWESVWTYDETYHWHKCSACGETCDKDKHALDVTAVQVPTPEKDGWKIYGCLTCDYSFSDKWEYGEEPKVGDIRPMMVLGASAALFTLAAAAYVFKRKTAV